MATNKISTGTHVGASGSATGQGRASDVGMDLTILFDAKSTSMYSPTFIVRPGEVMLLSGFGFQKHYMAIVEKLRYDPTGMPFGGMCEGAEQIVGGQTQAEDVTQCGLWALSPCQNVGVLAIPGTFRLRLGVQTTPGIGTIYVDAMRLTTYDAKLIPEDLFFGKISNCGCK